MTGDKVKEVCATYRNLLRLEAEHEGWEARPERMEDDSVMEWMVEGRHVLWMLDETCALADAGRLEKAFRWLGFVQGWLWATDRRTIGELKRDNMPAGEVFQR